MYAMTMHCADRKLASPITETPFLIHKTLIHEHEDIEYQSVFSTHSCLISLRYELSHTSLKYPHWEMGVHDLPQ